MKILITGIAGFAGSHLAELALREGAEVVGTILPGSPTEKLAWASAIVGLVVYVVGFAASFFLPEPKQQELPD